MAGCNDGIFAQDCQEDTVHLSGFGNHHSSEAVAGALPPSQNSPQHCPLGLYAEQLSGSAFGRLRHLNLHSWLYRILPSVVRQNYHHYESGINEEKTPHLPPNPLRWAPLPEKEDDFDWIDSLFHIASTSLIQLYLYDCRQSMLKRYFCSHDGELLFIPFQGKITLQTELGALNIAPGTIAVIPRGIYFKVVLLENRAKGYLCENSGAPFRLPELGIMGSNGLANPRHFMYPQAAYETLEAEIELICKFQQSLWITKNTHSPLNVVAWQGNYAPYCYDLSLFNTINSVSFDHPDPSIFTVLTSESNAPGIANLDFGIFPPRWMVANHTFRLPYFHRNIMSEFMGLIEGIYDAKEEGFAPGGFSIHNRMVPHGPDAAAFQKALKQKLAPEYYKHTLAFILESKEPWAVTTRAFNHACRQKDYSDCWQDLAVYFK